jgi:hypothetical protein
VEKTAAWEELQDIKADISMICEKAVDFLNQQIELFVGEYQNISQQNSKTQRQVQIVENRLGSVH